MYNSRRFQSDTHFRDPHSQPYTLQSQRKQFTRSSHSLPSIESTDHLDVPTSPYSESSFEVDTSLPTTPRPSSPASTVSSLTVSISSVPSRTFIDRAQKPKGARRQRKRKAAPTPRPPRPPRSPSLYSTYTTYDADPLGPLPSTMQSIGRKADSKQLRMPPRRTAPPVSRSAFMSSSNTSLSTLRTHNQRVVEQPHNIRHPYSYSYTTSPGPSVLEFPNRGTMKDSPSAGYTWLSELNYYDSDVSMGQFASRIKAQSNHKLNSKASSISGTSVASTTRTYATAQSQSAHPLVRPLPPIPASNPPDKPKKKRHVPPPLQLADSARRMEGLAPVLDNEVSIPPSSLLSPNISTAALTPISPAFKKPSEHEQRRRKMMKVGKIFGENVPVDLVLPPRRSSEDIPPVPALPPIATGAGPRAEDNTGDDSNRRSSLTLPSLGLSSLTAAIRPKKPEAIRPKVVRKKKSFKSHREGARRRSSNHDLRATRSPTLPTHPARFQLIVQDEDSKDTKSDDEDYQLVQSLPYRSRIEPGYFPTLARDAPFLYAQLPGSPGLQGDGRHGVLRRERRQGWSGEWNQEDIQEVITKLRELK